MSILILYGTSEGQTRKIAEFVSDIFGSRGHTVALVDAASATVNDVKLDQFDAAVVAASLHVGRYQTQIEDFVRARSQTLNLMRTMFLPVSLSAASDDPQDLTGMRECAAKFLAATKWTPGETHHVAGAFRYTQYDFFKRWAMKFIAYQKGVSTNTGRDLELTNWKELATFAEAFATEVARTQTLRREAALQAAKSV